MKFKSKDDANKEMKKCRDNPYYFMTTYCQVNGQPYKTWLTELQFNNMIKSFQTSNLIINGRKIK